MLETDDSATAESRGRKRASGRMTVIRFSGYLLVFLGGMLAGMLVCRYQLPPYDVLKAGIALLKPAPPPPAHFLKTPPESLQTDVDSLITLRSAEDLQARREALIHFLWGTGLPSTMPSVSKNHRDDRYDMPSLLRIHKLVVAMGFGLESHLYHFVPKSPIGRAVLYHQGHRGDFIRGKELITRLLDEGYDVVALAMPLLGPNPQPTVDLPRFGRLKLTGHDHLKLLTPESGHPVQYFLEPAVAATNYLRELGIPSISMIGISGGGWTTTLAAAVDVRLEKSFPVAGSYPIFLRAARDWGDYEQTVPELYNLAGYLDLYLLGSVGDGRKQVQIINQFDACCFAGTLWQTYQEPLESAVARLGSGSFELFVDDSHREHMISSVAVDHIVRELNRR